jgi:hypothetical protein
MSILRHSKINITMEIYTETTSEPTRDALRSSATGSREPGCCRLLLHQDQKGPVPRSELAFDLHEVRMELRGYEPPDPLHAGYIQVVGPASSAAYRLLRSSVGVGVSRAALWSAVVVKVPPTTSFHVQQPPPTAS